MNREVVAAMPSNQLRPPLRGCCDILSRSSGLSRDVSCGCLFETNRVQLLNSRFGLGLSVQFPIARQVAKNRQ